MFAGKAYHARMTSSIELVTLFTAVGLQVISIAFTGRVGVTGALEGGGIV